MVDYKEIKLIKDGTECVPFVPNKADKSVVDNLLLTKASKLELENAVEDVSKNIPQKISELENDSSYVNETALEKEILKLNKELQYKVSFNTLYDRTPEGLIIQSCSPYMNDSTEYIECNGEKLKYGGNIDNLEITLYPLIHITDNGQDYLTELYTSNKLVCSNDIADIDDIYYYDRKTGKYRHLEEEFSMSKGIVTSLSGFFDGEHKVDLENPVEVTVTDMWHREFDVPYKKVKDVLPDCYHDGELITDNQLPNMTGYNCYSAAETDRTISCNGYLTNIIDGKHNSSGTYNSETSSWASLDLTDKTSQDFWMEFDWITPSTFKAGNLFHGYRSLVLNVSATGGLTFYLAGYKSSNSLKWRISARNTGIVFEPNTKYKIAVKSWRTLKSETNTNLTTNPNPTIDTYSIKGYTITVAPYLKDYNNRYVLDYENQQTDCVLTAYAPYNYYSSYGMRTLYHADASVYVGGFIDLRTLKIWMKDCENTYPNIDKNDLYEAQGDFDRSKFTPIYTSGTIVNSDSQNVFWATGSDVVEVTGTAISGDKKGVWGTNSTWNGLETYFYDGDFEKLLDNKNIPFDKDTLNEVKEKLPYSVNKVWTPLSKYSQTTKDIDMGSYAPYIPPKNNMKYYRIL